MKQTIERAIDTIGAGLEALSAAMEDPSTLSFAEARAPFERLQKSMSRHSFAMVSFAWLVQRDDGGRAVHSHRPVDYLTKELGMSYSEAMHLLETARRLYAPAAKETAAEDLLLEQPSEPKDRVNQAEQAQEEARQRLRETQTAQQRTVEMINRELGALNSGSRTELFNRALQESERRGFSSLRSWLRDQIRRANAARKDPFAATRKREFWFGTQDSDGGVRFGGYMDAVTAAMLAKAMGPAARPGGPNIPEDEDTRTLKQRRADVFSAMLQTFLSEKEAKHRGMGSLVISATLEDLDSLSPDSLLPTDTGHLLSPADILRLGSAAADYLCLLDGDFRPLALGRGQRTASLDQYIALVATQLCCTAGDCEKPAVAADVHHVIAWSHGGTTDISNMALLCRGHHGSNNDNWDGTHNMGHMEVCPETGRVGFRAPGATELVFNDSPFFQHSALAKMLRRRARQASTDGPPDAPGAMPEAA